MKLPSFLDDAEPEDPVYSLISWDLPGHRFRFLPKTKGATIVSNSNRRTPGWEKKNHHVDTN